MDDATCEPALMDAASGDSAGGRAALALAAPQPGAGAWPQPQAPSPVPPPPLQRGPRPYLPSVNAAEVVAASQASSMVASAWVQEQPSSSTPARPTFVPARVQPMMRGPWPIVVQAPAPKRGRAGWVLAAVLGVLLLGATAVAAVAITGKHDASGNADTATADTTPANGAAGAADEIADGAAPSTTIAPLPTLPAVPVATLPPVPVSTPAPVTATPSKYPEAFRTEYLKGCKSPDDPAAGGAIRTISTTVGTGSSFCECTLNAIEATITLPDFIDLLAEFKQTGVTPDPLKAAIARCL